MPESAEAQEARFKRRMEACLTMAPRNLNANINPGYMVPRLGFKAPAWTGGNAPTVGAVSTETLDRYRYRLALVDKTAHLRKDDIKLYVEKALQVHDARKGMPVVSSPIWAPAK
mmetsp:Transcript_7432/g.19504  ORF Transcript_7432/g.19504 Transcript_7432/m.19504 type:complete len:114 (-) Transcript_7432:193-534(-)|eukprot:CAMPEP_0115830736 /NCGR_PEP_ID=MMETSP0287-20121206/1769_1 /TAXON_ID=412157 /ORGANISM="Chrysochromulina rotalis, Strain UIO044" /LENGTH=113 /DNA_ID=CAMNT_0003284045 /DNA_START=66 /DNA_END=407 /DNA_ORIENTATION=+